MINFNVEFKDGAYHLKCGMSTAGIYTYARIMEVTIDEAKEAIIQKGVFNATENDIWDVNSIGLDELAKELNEVNDKKVEMVEQGIKKAIDEDRKFAWALFVSACGSDMRTWSMKAMKHINKEKFNWMEGYPSAPFDRFITETIKIFQSDLASLISKTAISSGTISEFVKKHLH